jgi:hypothetical protein
MSHYCALFSIVFMISFVALFDCMHIDRRNDRFCRDGLLSRDDIDLLIGILAACNE